MEIKMNYIIFDLEWNQCPSGKEDEVAELPFEIFEIGAVKLDESMERTGSFSCYIKPQVYKELHYIAKGLTHVTQKELDEGRSFSEVVKAFFAWCASDGENINNDNIALLGNVGLNSDTSQDDSTGLNSDTYHGSDYRLCTWGTSDLVELQRNMKYYGIESPLKFPLFYYDVQKLFSIDKEDGKVRRSLETAVDMLEIEKNIDFHSAINDAEYTAKVLKKLDLKKTGAYFSIDTYRIPECANDEIIINYGSYEKYITRGYDTKEELVNNTKLLSTKCYLCGRTARKRIRWFTMNSKMHYCLAECKEHGYIKGRFKIRENDNGKFYASRILKITGEDGAEEVRQRQLEVRKRRREKRQKKK